MRALRERRFEGRRSCFHGASETAPIDIRSGVPTRAALLPPQHTCSQEVRVRRAPICAHRGVQTSEGEIRGRASLNWRPSRSAVADKALFQERFCRSAPVEARFAKRRCSKRSLLKRRRRHASRTASTAGRFGRNASTAALREQRCDRGAYPATALRGGRLLRGESDGTLSGRLRVRRNGNCLRSSRRPAIVNASLIHTYGVPMGFAVKSQL
jgi:hypothetical protein